MDYQDLEPFHDGNLPILSNHEILQILILTFPRDALGMREAQRRKARQSTGQKRGAAT